MDVHQRNRGGNSRIVETMSHYFRCPESFEEMCWLSQTGQGLAMKTAIEFWRANKPRCMGMLYRQLNDTWPVASWASLEYGGGWKATQYLARRFYAPVMVTAQPDETTGSLSGAGEFLSRTVLNTGVSPMMIMRAVVLIYLVPGMFLEPISAMLLTLPILLPVVDGGGFGLLWFGIIVTKLLEIGMFTPPIGMKVFVIKGIVGGSISTAAIFKGIWWFLVMDIILLGILIVFPSIVTFLPLLWG